MKIFTALLLGTALMFSASCKKKEKTDDKAAVDPAAKPADPAAKPADPAAKPADPAAKPAEPAAASGDSVGAAECDELIKRTKCSFDKAGAAMPAESKKAFEDGIKAWKDALAKPETKQATIDACKASLDAGKAGFDAQGC